MSFETCATTYQHWQHCQVCQHISLFSINLANWCPIIVHNKRSKMGKSKKRGNSWLLMILNINWCKITCFRDCQQWQVLRRCEPSPLHAPNILTWLRQHGFLKVSSENWIATNHNWFWCIDIRNPKLGFIVWQDVMKWTVTLTRCYEMNCHSYNWTTFRKDP